MFRTPFSWVEMQLPDWGFAPVTSSQQRQPTIESTMSQLINIDQVRAKNAVGAEAQRVKKDDSEGKALSGYPSLIINNGLIATVAYSIDKKGQNERIADAIAFHLSNLPGENLLGNHPINATGLRTALCEGEPSLLKRCTYESLEFLSYLKRFQRG